MYHKNNNKRKGNKNSKTNQGKENQPKPVAKQWKSTPENPKPQPPKPRPVTNKAKAPVKMVNKTVNKPKIKPQPKMKQSTENVEQVEGFVTDSLRKRTHDEHCGHIDSPTGFVFRVKRYIATVKSNGSFGIVKHNTTAQAQEAFSRHNESYELWNRNKK